MKKQELIKHIEDLPYKEGPIVDKIDISRKGLLELVKQLDEPEKVKIPQFVADWIEECKKELSLREAMLQANVSIEINDWLVELDENGDFLNQYIFARAWFDGYEVEKEPKYTVKTKGISGYGRYLNKVSSSKKYCFASENEAYGYITKHTRRELEQDGFGEVFNSPLFEVEEVE